MLTVLLNTFNRTDFLARNLQYLAATEMEYQINVVDASWPECFSKNQETIKHFGKHSGKRLKIEHQKFESTMGINEVIWRGFEQISTPYAVLLADDDLIYPKSLQHAVSYLEANPNCELAQGQQIIFMTQRDAVFSPPCFVGRTKMVDFSVEGKSATARIETRIRQNTRHSAPKIGFGVARTKTAVRIWRETLALGLNNSFTEAVLDQLFLIAGDIKLLNKVYILRQEHRNNAARRAHSVHQPIVVPTSYGKQFEIIAPENLNTKTPSTMDYFDQLVSPLSAPQFERKIDCLAHDLAQRDSLDLDHAREIIKNWEWHFLGKNLLPKYSEHRRNTLFKNRVSPTSTSLTVERSIRKFRGALGWAWDIKELLVPGSYLFNSLLVLRKTLSGNELLTPT